MKKRKFPWWEKLTLKLIKVIKKGDILLVLILIAVCIIWFLPKDNGEKIRAEIFLDGNSVHSFVLSDVSKPQTVSVAGCEILVEKDGVTFLESSCSDSLCVKRGKMTKSGDAMACVPQRVVVTLKSEKNADFDSVVY